MIFMVVSSKPKKIGQKRPKLRIVKSKPEVAKPNNAVMKKRILKVIEKDRANLLKFIVAEKLTARELRQLGIPLYVLRRAYISIKSLRNLGYSMEEVIKTGKLVGMSVNVKDLFEAGYPIEEFVYNKIHLYHIVLAGFKAPALRSVGITAKRLQAAKYSNSALLKLGFAENELK